MKRAFAILLILALMTCIPACAGQIDLSGLSFEELVALRDRCQKEMMLRSEWQQVEVPQGVWRVGVDIPAGTWTIKCTAGAYTFIEWGTALDESGHDIAYSRGRQDSALVKNPRGAITESGDRLEYTFTVKNGDYIVIKDSSATFYPYAGQPDLGFKWGK